MFTFKVSPKFGEIDGLGHINNTVLPGWFENARNPLYRFFNPDFDFTKWNLILAHFEFDFIGQMFFHSDVEIKTWISKIGRSSYEVYQEAWQNGTACVKGKTVIVYYDFDKQKSAPIPPEQKEMLKQHLVPVEILI
jgi:acyl-CoA thioester hydrolase